MHPPRSLLFKITEINPFPYIKPPYKKGNAWTWGLKIGSHYGDERWATWEGNIDNECQYKITGTKKLETKLGKLKCYVVESSCQSRLGKTGLTSYFHPAYGFVKLDYDNINGSKLVIEMVETGQMTDRELGINSDGFKIRPGEPAADFTVQMLDSTNITLSDLKGKVVLLYFWKTGNKYGLERIKKICLNKYWPLCQTKKTLLSSLFREEKMKKP